MPDEVISELRGAFQESDLPYLVDLVDETTVFEDFRHLIRQQAIKLR